MAKNRWDPFNDVTELRERMNALFEQSMVGDHGISTAGSFSPLVDVVDTGGGFEILLELPGIDPKEVTVKATDRSVSVKGERRRRHTKKGASFHRMERHYGHFQSKIDLPDRIDADAVEADYKLGVLKIKLPKKR